MSTIGRKGQANVERGITEACFLRWKDLVAQQLRRSGSIYDALVRPPERGKSDCKARRCRPRQRAAPAGDGDSCYARECQVGCAGENFLERDSRIADGLQPLFR